MKAGALPCPNALAVGKALAKVPQAENGVPRGIQVYMMVILETALLYLKTLQLHCPLSVFLAPPAPQTQDANVLTSLSLSPGPLSKSYQFLLNFNF